MRDLPKPRVRKPAAQFRHREDDRGLQAFWHWFAVGVLLFCWVAEATLCAQRGF